MTIDHPMIACVSPPANPKDDKPPFCVGCLVLQHHRIAQSFTCPPTCSATPSAAAIHFIIDVDNDGLDDLVSSARAMTSTSVNRFRIQQGPLWTGQHRQPVGRVHRRHEQRWLQGHLRRRRYDGVHFMALVRWQLQLTDLDNGSMFSLQRGRPGQRRRAGHLPLPRRRLSRMWKGSKQAFVATRAPCHR